jgi:hypothetical protein
VVFNRALSSRFALSSTICQLLIGSRCNSQVANIFFCAICITVNPFDNTRVISNGVELI